MLVQLAAGIACLIATILQLAVYRDPLTIDRPMRRTGRRIMMVAMLIGSVLAFHAAAVATGDNSPTAAGFLALLLAAMSQSLYAFSDLMPHLEQEYRQWTSRLNNSP